jgi:hypothetical protein
MNKGIGDLNKKYQSISDLFGNRNLCVSNRIYTFVSQKKYSVTLSEVTVIYNTFALQYVQVYAPGLLLCALYIL